MDFKEFYKSRIFLRNFISTNKFSNNAIWEPKESKNLKKVILGLNNLNTNASHLVILSRKPLSPKTYNFQITYKKFAPTPFLLMGVSSKDFSKSFTARFIGEGHLFNSNHLYCYSSKNYQLGTENNLSSTKIKYTTPVDPVINAKTVYLLTIEVKYKKN